MRTMTCTAGWWTPPTRKRVATHLLRDISFFDLPAYMHVFTYGTMIAKSDESRAACIGLPRWAPAYDQRARCTRPARLQPQTFQVRKRGCGDTTSARKVAGDGRRRAGVMMRRGLTLEVRVATFGALGSIWLVLLSQNNSPTLTSLEYTRELRHLVQ